MKITLMLFLALIFFMQSHQNCDKKEIKNIDRVVLPTPEKMKYDRLPDGISLETKVTKVIKNENGDIISSDTITVKDILTAMNARYQGGKLVDEKDREIKFFKPYCVGVSQGFEEDQRAQKEKDAELAELKKNFTVVILYCDPLNVY